MIETMTLSEYTQFDKLYASKTGEDTDVGVTELKDMPQDVKDALIKLMKEEKA